MSDEVPGSPAALSEESASSAAGADDALSPAVRRLLKLYDLDASKIQGTGPDGRLRVSDIMSLVGVGSSNLLAGDAEPGPAAPRSSEPGQRHVLPATTVADMPVTSVFECDMTAVLTHRKHMLVQKTDILLTSYYLVAAAAALRTVPEAIGQIPAIDIAIALSAPGERTATPVLRRADRLSLFDANRLLREAHHRLAAGETLDHEAARAPFLLFHHGLTGSLLAMPTPLLPGNAASLGVGRIRRQLAVQNDSDQQGPRIAPVCYVSLSFRAPDLDIHRANQFLSVFVHRLEHWPRETQAQTATAPRDAAGSDATRDEQQESETRSD